MYSVKDPLWEEESLFTKYSSYNSTLDVQEEDNLSIVDELAGPKSLLHSEYYYIYV